MCVLKAARVALRVIFLGVGGAVRVSRVQLA